jgi:sugar/nucleoside kinase (ribokinase family)
MKKILGLGNALVDIMTVLKNDSFLEEVGLPKGSMQLVDADVSNEIYKKTEGFEKTIASGGSVANMIYGIAKLGASAGYIGKINKDDELGKFFENDMESAGVDTHLIFSNTPTGKAIALVSPDAERTFATYLGAAVELSKDELDSQIFSNYDIFVLEGYLVYNEELVLKAIEIAKANNMLIAIDMASYNVVEDKRDFLDRIIRKYVDIVFANEEEAKAFTGLEPEEALHKIAENVLFSVVKIGEKGSLIKYDGKVYRIPAIKVNPVDTTGAGDFYAAGFLYGLTRGFSPEKCGAVASFLAGKVTETIGAKPNKNVWEEIKSLY